MHGRTKLNSHGKRVKLNLVFHVTSALIDAYESKITFMRIKVNLGDEQTKFNLTC